MFPKGKKSKGGTEPLGAAMSQRQSALMAKVDIDEQNDAGEEPTSKSARAANR